MQLMAKFTETDAIFFHLECQLIDRDVSICIFIYFFKEKSYLLTSEVWVDVSYEYIELFVLELFRILEAQILDQPTKIDVFGVHLKTQLGHDCLQLVLKLLVFLSELMKGSVENWMQENFIPRKTILLCQGQSASQEIFCTFRNAFIYDQWFRFYIFDQLKFRLCGPGRFSVQHLIENEPCRPNIAFTCIRFRFQHLGRHVEGSADGCRDFHAISHVFLSETKISDFYHSLTKHQIGRLEVTALYHKYRWTMPYLSSAIKPLQICFSKSMASVSWRRGVLERKCCRSESHSSWMMQQLWLLYITSKTLTTLSDLRSCRILISEKRAAFRYQSRSTGQGWRYLLTFIGLQRRLSAWFCLASRDRPFLGFLYAAEGAFAEYVLKEDEIIIDLFLRHCLLQLYWLQAIQEKSHQFVGKIRTPFSFRFKKMLRISYLIYKQKKLFGNFIKSLMMRCVFRCLVYNKSGIKKGTMKDNFDLQEFAYSAPNSTKTKSTLLPCTQDGEVTTKPPKVKKMPNISMEEQTNARELTLTKIIEWRKTHIAPVDTMGCERLADPTAPLQIQKFQTLVSLMLSIQTKDQTTSMVVNRLKQYGLTPQSMATISPQKLVELIYECNFNKRKAKNIIQVSNLILKQGIARTKEELMEYPGIGVKIAMIYMNVVEGQQEGIGVDTHVHRICNRLGWVKTDNPNSTQKELQNIFHKKFWKEMNIAFVGFGQLICNAKKPLCSQCPVSADCPSSTIKW